MDNKLNHEQELAAQKQKLDNLNLSISEENKKFETLKTGSPISGISVLNLTEFVPKSNPFTVTNIKAKSYFSE